MKLEVLSERPVNPTRKTPLLFVHGAWHGAWCWQEHFLGWFAQQGFEAHALSLRGHGNSEGAEKLRWASFNDYVEDIASVAAGLSTSPAIIAHSMGGMVTQKYLGKYQAPAAVLLASSPPTTALPTTIGIAKAQPLNFLKVNLTLSLYPLVASPEQVGAAFFSASMPAEDIERYAGLIGDESYRAFLDMLGLSLPKPKKVKTPMLVLGAENDAIFTMQQVKDTAAAYNTTAEFFPKMAHDMMLESGWEKVAERILKYLDEQAIV